MYRHYCKDPRCPGHTKNWERCCDLRAFATPGTQRAKQLSCAQRPQITTATAFTEKKPAYA